MLRVVRVRELLETHEEPLYSRFSGSCRVYRHASDRSCGRRRRPRHVDDSVLNGVALACGDRQRLKIGGEILLLARCKMG